MNLFTGRRDDYDDEDYSTLKSRFEREQRQREKLQFHSAVIANTAKARTPEEIQKAYDLMRHITGI
jgi:hypothetical protein